MTKDDKLYFNWLINKVTDKKKKKFYNNLFDRLFDTPMRADINQMDQNFIHHGIQLRREYIYEQQMNLSVNIIYRDCSVLEFLVALCIAGEDIMTDEDYGDRTPLWFWLMIRNLGLNDMDDGRFDVEKVDFVLNTFMDRNFNYDGSGGNIIIIDNGKDLRDIPFWIQFSMYLASIS